MAANYQFTQTGAEIQAILDKAQSPDSAPTAGSQGLVTSGGVKTALDEKVDKVSGKGLSTNDYTDAEKSKLAGVAAGAQVNVIEGVQVNGSNLPVSGKKVNVTVPAPIDNLTSTSTTSPLSANQGKVLDGKVTALGQKVNRIVYTDNANANKVIQRLFFDVSGYTGSYSLSGLRLKILARDVSGAWGVQLGNDQNQTVASFWMTSEQRVQEATQNGIYLYAEYVWSEMSSGSLTGRPFILTNYAFVDDPRGEVRTGNIADKAVTAEKLADGVVPPFSDMVYGSVGDSITAGVAIVNTLPNDDKFIPLYGPAKATYAYWIARKNNAKWYNYGISGSTLGDVNVGGLDKNGFSKAGGRYTQLANDLTHISIFFGWNDSAYGRQMKKQEYATATWGGGNTILYPQSSSQYDKIGTAGWVTQAQFDEIEAMTGSVGGVTYNIPSEYWQAVYVGLPTDSTNKTFWGAWNIVLPYLINKYPLAKILLVVPYGANPILRQAVRDAAYKYGLEYYDFAKAGHQLFYGYEDETPAPSGVVNGVSITNFRRAGLVPDSAHPNEDGYKYLWPSINAALIKL